MFNKLDLLINVQTTFVTVSGKLYHNNFMVKQLKYNKYVSFCTDTVHRFTFEDSDDVESKTQETSLLT